MPFYCVEMLVVHALLLRTCLGADGKQVPTFSLCVNGTLLPPNLLWQEALPTLLKKRLTSVLDAHPVASFSRHKQGRATVAASGAVEAKPETADAQTASADTSEGPTTLGTIWARAWLTHILREFNLGGTSVEAMSTRLLETLLVMRYAHLWVGSFADPATATWESDQQGRGEWVHVRTPHGAVWRCRAGLPALQPHALELLTVCCVYAAARLSGFFLHMKDLLTSVTAAYADPRLLLPAATEPAEGVEGWVPPLEPSTPLLPGTLSRYDSTSMAGPASSAAPVPAWVSVLRSTFKQYNLLHASPAGQDILGAVFGPPQAAAGAQMDSEESSAAHLLVLKRAARFRHPAQQLAWPVGTPRGAHQLPSLPHTMLTAARSWRRFYTTGVSMKWHFAHPALLIPEGGGSARNPTLQLQLPALGSSSSAVHSTNSRDLEDVYGPILPPARKPSTSAELMSRARSSEAPNKRRRSASHAMFRMASIGSAHSRQLSQTRQTSEGSSSSRGPRLAMHLPLEALLPMVRGSLSLQSGLEGTAAGAGPLGSKSSSSHTSSTAAGTASTTTVADIARSLPLPWLSRGPATALTGGLLRWPSALSESSQQCTREETGRLLQSTLQLSGGIDMSLGADSGDSPFRAPSALSLRRGVSSGPRLMPVTGGGLPGVPSEHNTQQTATPAQSGLPRAPPSLDLVRAMTALSGARDSLSAPLSPNDSAMDPHTWAPPPHIRASTAGAPSRVLPPRSCSSGSGTIPPPPAAEGGVSVITGGRSLSSGAVMEGGSGFSGAVVGVQGMSQQQSAELARLSAQLHTRLKSRPGSTRHSLQSPGQSTPRQLATPHASQNSAGIGVGVFRPRRCSATDAMVASLEAEAGSSDDEAAESTMLAPHLMELPNSSPLLLAHTGLSTPLFSTGAGGSEETAQLRRRSAAQAALLAMPQHTHLQLSRSQESNPEQRSLTDLDDRNVSRDTDWGGVLGGVPTAGGAYVPLPETKPVGFLHVMTSPVDEVTFAPSAGLRAASCALDVNGWVQPGGVCLETAASAMASGHVRPAHGEGFKACTACASTQLSPCPGAHTATAPIEVAVEVEAEGEGESTATQLLDQSTHSTVLKEQAKGHKAKKRTPPTPLERRRTDSDLVVPRSSSGVALPRTPRGAALNGGGLQLMRQGAAATDAVLRSSSAQAWSTVLRAASGQTEARAAARDEPLDEAPLPCKPPVAEVSQASDSEQGLQPQLQRAAAGYSHQHSSSGHEGQSGSDSGVEGGPPKASTQRPSLFTALEEATGTLPPLSSDASQLPMLSPGEPSFEDFSDGMTPPPPPALLTPQLSRQSSQMDAGLPSLPPQSGDGTGQGSSFGLAGEGDGCDAAANMASGERGSAARPSAHAQQVPTGEAVRRAGAGAAAGDGAAADASGEGAVTGEGATGSVAEYYHSVFVPHISQLLAWLQSFSDA